MFCQNIKNALQARDKGIEEIWAKVTVINRYRPSFLSDGRSRVDHFPSSEVTIVRFPDDMIGQRARVPQHGGRTTPAAAAPPPGDDKLFKT